jgi:hypothetical protein
MMRVALGDSVRFWIPAPTAEDPARIRPIVAIVNSVQTTSGLVKAGLTVFWPSDYEFVHAATERIDGVPASDHPVDRHFTYPSEEYPEASR